MSKTVYFVGSEPDCVTGNYTLSTTGVDTNYVRTGIKTAAGESATITLASPAPANSAEGFWVHCRKYQDNTDHYVNDHPITIYDENNNISAQIINGSEKGAIRARIYANDGTYTDSDISYAFFHYTTVNGSTVTIDLHVYTNGSGQAKIDAYINGSFGVSATDTSGYNRGMKSATFKRITLNSTWYHVWSEFIVANFDTRNLRVGTYYPSADGTYTDGTGTYADIDETTLDANVITLAEVGDQQSYGVTKHGTPVLGGILAVAVNGLIASDGTNDLQAGLRIGGVDYFSSDLNLGATPRATSVVWNAHPGTGLFLPQNPATDIEVIYKAVA